VFFFFTQAVGGYSWDAGTDPVLLFHTENETLGRVHVSRSESLEDSTFEVAK
jgi:hypothetical protein